ncbi:hypothetical protein [Leptospira interrogans]|uniref:hypothetical protein n=1 Tax=Leptospira interrogans TaxID=173 RepID=UPI0030D857F2
MRASLLGKGRSWIKKRGLEKINPRIEIKARKNPEKNNRALYKTSCTDTGPGFIDIEREFFPGTKLQEEIRMLSFL